MNRNRRRILRIKKWLCKNFPPPVPVRVIVGDMPKEYSDCVGIYQPPCSSKYATIRLSKSQGHSEKINTLLHEWVHLCIDPEAEAANKPHGGHTNEFYLTYGKIERAYFSALDDELRVRNKK